MTQVVLFLVAVYGVTWTLWLVLRPLASAGQIWPAVAWIIPTVWAPTIAALILIRSEGSGAVGREVRARLTLTRGSGPWLVLAVIAPAAAVAAAVFVARAGGEGAPFARAGSLPVMIVLQLLTGAVGEELGWRGFLLPRLGVWLRPIAAAWTMGILWSLWHVPAFFFPGMPHQLAPMIPNLLMAVFFGIFMAFLFNRTGESVPATMLAHFSFNISAGFGGVQFSSVIFWWTLAGLFGAVALFITGTRALRPRHASPVYGEVRT